MNEKPSNIPDPNSNSSEQSPDETIELGNEPHDSTGDTTIIPSSPEVTAGTAGASNPESSQSTVGSGPSKTRVYAGNKSRRTLSNLSGRTKSNLDGSIMESVEIDRTINPRELSDKDAAAWNSAVHATVSPDTTIASISGVTAQQSSPQSKAASQLSPAIDRTFSDRQFQRLRVCKVAETPDEPEVPLDFRLVKKLGQGGMGDVYLAHQASLDRMLALKLIKPIEGRKRAQLTQTGKLDEFEETRRQQFLSEAIVTSDLDHPNIVPIHEAGFSSDGNLFYAMKCVVGDPWSDKIKSFSRDQNLEVLMKVCDAIACAHNRGVVHRDIKPQNIMLGGFGVVLVMDWGLALPTPKYDKSDTILATSGLGGTPAFMAPEMAVGPMTKIGPASDIYLLGATLYLIITGHAPHHGRNVTECMMAVRNNSIRPAAPEHRGELLQIAMKAMESDPKNRYPDVESFQAAIRDYREHAESIALATNATRELDKAIKIGSYSAFSRATFGFEESIKSWNGNAKAHQGIAEATRLHAETAYAKGDFELGLSLLDENNAEHVDLIARLTEGLRESKGRVKRIALLRKLAAAMLSFILIGGGAAMYVINEARLVADRERKIAVDQTLIAQQQTELANEEKERANAETIIAEEATRLATKAQAEEKSAREGEAAQRKIAEINAEAARVAERKALDEKKAAEEAKVNAELARNEAEREKQRAEYEEYVSKIGLAKVRLEDNDAENAREILIDLRKSPLSDSWEWRWLWQQANQSTSDVRSESPVVDLSMNENGTRGFAALSDGRVERIELDDQGNISKKLPLRIDQLATQRACAVASSPSGDYVAVGTTVGDIVVVALDGSAQHLPRSHTATVTDLRYVNESLIASASEDRTVRFWNVNAPSEWTADRALWHLSPVRQISIANEDDESSFVLAAAVSDTETGSVVLWKVSVADELIAEQSGTFLEHAAPVSAVAISDDAGLVASGDTQGNVLIWSPNSVDKVDYSESIVRALSVIDESPSRLSQGRQRRERLPIARLVDTTSRDDRRFVSVVGSNSKAPTKVTQLAHDEAVRAIQFTRDATTLVTAAADNLLKLWDVDSRQLQHSLRGHGGWLVGAEFLSGNGDQIVSASNDQTIRTWRPKTHLDSYVSHQTASPESAEFNRDTSAHENVITSVKFSSDATKVVTASEDRTARVMEIDSETLQFREIARLDDELLDEGTPFVAMSMHVDRPHQRLYLGSADSTIRVWDLEASVEIGRASKTGLNSSFAVSADGTLMLTGSNSADVNAILWRLDPVGNTPPTILHRLSAHHETVTALAISPDSRTLFTGDRGGFGVLWDAVTGKRLARSVENVRGFRINAAIFSHDGHELLIAADDEQLSRIDIRTHELIGRMSHDGFVTQLALSHDGHSALTVSEWLTKDQLRTAATLWDLRSAKRRVLDEIKVSLDDGQAISSRSRSRITSANFDDDSRFVAIGRSTDSGHGGTVKMWDLETSDEPVVYALPQQLGASEVVVPLDGRSLLTMNENGAFRWDLAAEKLVSSYRSHAQLTEASFSFDDQFVITSSRSVKLWNASTGKALAKLEAPHAGPVRTACMSPLARKGDAVTASDSSYMFATGGDDGVARIWLWNAKSNDFVEIRRLARSGERHPIRRVCFSPSGEQLLAVGDLGQVALWTILESTPPLILDRAESGNFISAAFSQDGRVIAAGSTNHTALVWSLAGQSQSADSSGGPKFVLLDGHAGEVSDIAIQGTLASTIRVLTASSKDARLWDPRLDAQGVPLDPKGREVVSLRGHDSDVSAVDVSRDRRMLLTASKDGTVVLWPAESPSDAAAPVKPSIESHDDADLFDGLLN